MIQIIENKREKLYKYSYFYSNRLITKNGYKTKEGLYWNDYPANIKLGEIFKLEVENFPKKMGLFIQKTFPKNDYFRIESFEKDKQILRVRFMLYEDDRYGENYADEILDLYNAMEKTLEFDTDFIIEISSWGPESTELHLLYEDKINNHIFFESFFEEGINKLNTLIEKSFLKRGEYDNYLAINKDRVRNLIAKAKLEEAIKDLKVQISDLKNDNNFISLEARFSDNEKHKINGEITQEEYSIRKNNLVKSFLEFVDKA